MTMLLRINWQSPLCEAEAAAGFEVHNLKQTATGYECGEKKTARRRQTRGSSGVAGVEELSLHSRGSRHRTMANFPNFLLMELYSPLSILLGHAHHPHDEH